MRFSSFLLKHPRLLDFLFSHYSYFKRYEEVILFFLPPTLRAGYFHWSLGRFGKGSRIETPFHYRYGRKIQIGANVEINRGCVLYPSYLMNSGRIYIGNNTVIAPNVTFLGAGQEASRTREHIAGDIFIGENVYIGANSTIRYGVKVGDFSTIAAGSVVVADVPPKTVVGGVPARVIKHHFSE